MVTLTVYSGPAAQSGSQPSIFSVPVPTASLPVHVGQVMSQSTVVPSPDSGQPAWQPGACAVVPLTSWLSAKYTSAPDGTEPAWLVTEGVADAWAGDAEATAAAVVAGPLAAARLAGAGAL